jgi:hypothetical protein
VPAIYGAGHPGAFETPGFSPGIFPRKRNRVRLAARAVISMHPACPWDGATNTLATVTPSLHFTVNRQVHSGGESSPRSEDDPKRPEARPLRVVCYR